MKHIGELVDGMGDRVKTAIWQPSFVAEFGNCEEHGQYPRNQLGADGVTRWYPDDRCPICRRRERASRLLQSSNIPARFADCSFENYVVSSDKQGKVLARCRDYADNFATYRKNGACLLLCGAPGTGKNHLATAITRRLHDGGYTVLRVKAQQYLDNYWAKGFEARESWLREIAGIDLLMLDEVGRSSESKSAQDAFFRVIDARYEAQLPTLLATNQNRNELMEILGSAAYDRLTQGGGIRLTLDWESYRPTAPTEGD